MRVRYLEESIACLKKGRVGGEGRESTEGDRAAVESDHHI